MNINGTFASKSTDNMNYENFVKIKRGDAIFFSVTEKAPVLILLIILVLKLK